MTYVRERFKMLIYTTAGCRGDHTQISHPFRKRASRNVAGTICCTMCGELHDVWSIDVRKPLDRIDVLRTMLVGITIYMFILSATTLG